MEEILKQILSELQEVRAGQTATNKRLDAMQADIKKIKEDTTVTRDVVNGVSEWTEIASDVLKINYPLQKAE